jgi:copper(I)-binding protein
MIGPLHRRSMLRASLALCASSVLAPAARACEFFAPNLRIIHPWTRATSLEDGFAVISMGFDQVTRADRLIGIETPVAEAAEMGGKAASRSVSFFIPEGRESALSEDSVHVRLVRLKQPLELGRSYPLKLVFERGGVVNADFDVDYERLR